MANNTEMDVMKPLKKNKLRNLRLSLKYRPKIMQLILKMRQGIRRRNAEIKSLKHRLKAEEKRHSQTQENSDVNPSVNTSKTFQSSSTQTETSDIESKEISKVEDSSKDNTTKQNIDTEPTQTTGWNKTNEKSIADQVKEAALNALNEFESKAGWDIDNRSGEKEKSIAEQVKEVAQNALQQRGMVYVESAGMYYDYKTGYYYNSELGLYYHTETNCYYYFSDEKQQFIFHSYPDTSAVNANLIAHQKKKARKQLKRERKPEDDLDNLTKTLSQDNEAKKSKRKKTKKNELTDQGSKEENGKTEVDMKISEEKADSTDIFETNDVETEEGKKVNNDEQTEEIVSVELEDGECSDSDGEEVDDDCSSNASTATKSDEDTIAKHHPPCMRVIVRETDLPKLKVGTLFLITKDGGTVGREGEQHTILIRDTNVSRNHLDVRYDMQKKTYVATDLGSKNGTILNGNRMSESSEISSPMDILHGSTIQLGETKLLCHIHAGNDTCGHCEPGLIMESEEKEKKAAYTRTCSVKKQHELELARLKNIYAPKLLEIEEKPYNDRAQARRETVGSSHHSVKTETADLDTSISTENKGFKLLQKMGWSEGEGLGKDCQGNTEPVPLVSNDGKAGLGTSGAVSAPPMTPKPRPKNTIASATMRLASRTKMLQPPAKAFQGDEDEEFE